jgi:hypothetical protein
MKMLNTIELVKYMLPFSTNEKTGATINDHD